MKRRWEAGPVWALLPAAVPGLILAAGGLLGWTVALRDGPAYFMPLRERTATVLRGQRGAFWNPNSGCGEPFFANPQSALLYPPAWLAVALPVQRAVTCEAGLHVALLGVGCAFLALRLKARPAMAAAAGFAVAIAGPTLDAAGVLNNLEAVAWAPWAWAAALGGCVPGLAVCVGLAFLAAEPQLALVIGVVAFALAPRRRTIAALALAVGLVALQLVPFLFWVAGGDRGSGIEVAETCAGAVTPNELPALVLPGLSLPVRPDRYVRHLFVPGWCLVLGLAVLFDRRRSTTVLVGAAATLLALAVLPALSSGHEIWAAATGGFVRYPARLIFPAVVALVTAAATLEFRPLRVPAAVLGLAVTLGFGGAALWRHAPLATAVAQGASAGLALVPGFGGVATWAGSLALVPDAVAVLEPAPITARRPIWCGEAQHSARGRVFAVQPSWDQLGWIARRGEEADRALSMGPASLADGRIAVRSAMPVFSATLVAHLAEADRGPAGRWWLDTLAADRIVSHGDIPGFDTVCRENGLTVYDNPQAWPLAQVVTQMPRPGGDVHPAGAVVGVDDRDDRRTFRIEVAPGGGWLLLSAAPDPGWRWKVDDRTVAVTQGPGILHGVLVPAGKHLVEARYRPPGLLAGAAGTLVSLLILAGVGVRSRRKRRDPLSVAPLP
ncbi:MAG: YfhO family protein [Acidobacteria bacterium]|nr:YfhO family protein [Acidobacteriota bacterium]